MKPVCDSIVLDSPDRHAVMNAALFRHAAVRHLHVNLPHSSSIYRLVQRRQLLNLTRMRMRYVTVARSSSVAMHQATRKPVAQHNKARRWP